MSKSLLFFIILVEGFITLSAEILTIRQLLPVVGNSVIVTSLIIGIFLLFLAYGYRKGGQYQNNYITILKNNFTIAAIWIGIGLSYAFILAFFTFFQTNLTQNVLISLSCYLMLVTAPLVYILGQTVPITMNLFKDSMQNTKIKTKECSAEAGAIGGKVLHWSTLGSFLGAILTSLLLMNYLGVAWTVFINFALLAILTLILYSTLQKDVLRYIVLVVGLVLAYGLNISSEREMFVSTNSYSNYGVFLDQHKSKYLMINEAACSLATLEQRGFPYIELVKKILFVDMGLQQKDILVLGAGGFSISAAGTQGNRFTYVDIDKDVHSVVKKYFLDKINGQFVAEDARAYLNAHANSYDVIFSDVYSNKRTIPAHLLTQEYFMSVRNSLRPNALAVFNVIARPTMDDNYSMRVDNTIRSVFNQCMVVPIKYIEGPQNIMYFCRNNNNIMKNDLYTDNQNQATLDFLNAQ